MMGDNVNSMNTLTIAHVNLARNFRGGERQTVLLMRYLKKAYPEIKQLLICRKGSAIPSYVSDIKDLEIHEISHSISGHFKLDKCADIIQAHEAKATQWVAIQHSLYKIPYVITRRVPQRLKNNFFNRYVFNNAATIISISQAIRESIIASFGRTVNLGGRLRLIYSVLAHMEADPKKVAQIKEQYKGCAVFGHIGAYVDKHKGQMVLIKAAKEFLKKHPNCRFVFLGYGEDENLFREASKDTPQIEWLGFHKDVVNYIESMDFFIFPSRNEGLGSVLLDIMDHKVPIIASNVDGIPEVVHDEETGLLFSNGDSAELLQKMERLYADSELQKKLKENAYNNLSKFRPEYMAERYMELYQEILNKNN